MAKEVAGHTSPDIASEAIDGQHVVAWSQAARAEEYNIRLASSRSVRVGERHYASHCFHRDIPSDGLVIDGVDDAFVNIVVDCNLVNRCHNQKSVVMM